MSLCVSVDWRAAGGQSPCPVEPESGQGQSHSSCETISQHRFPDHVAGRGELSRIQLSDRVLNFTIATLQGISELPPNIRRWIYLGTVFGPTAVPITSYGMIVASAFLFIFVFVRSYKNFVFQTDPTIEILEMGRRSLRRGSSFLVQQQHRLLVQRDSYVLLKADNNNDGDSPT